MIRVEHTVVIKRPIEEVFNFMAKVENLPRWAENTIEAQQTSQGPLGVQHDVYHMQIMEGDLARTIEANLEAICHIQPPTTRDVTSQARARSTSLTCSTTWTRSAMRDGSAASSAR